jgi:uncharacterized membrane protein YgdD (TMEM256/DUF423 family)
MLDIQAKDRPLMLKEIGCTAVSNAHFLIGLNIFLGSFLLDCIQVLKLIFALTPHI